MIVKLLAILTVVVVRVQGDVYQIVDGRNLVFEVSFKPPQVPNTSYLSLQSRGTEYVYLEVKNSQYELTIQQGENHEIYTLPCVNSVKPITFKWPDKVINGLVMNKVLQQGNTSVPDLDTCQLNTPINRVTFFASAANQLDVIQPSSDLSKLTYHKPPTDKLCFILIPIIILCVLGSRFDSIWAKLRRYNYLPQDVVVDQTYV